MEVLGLPTLISYPDFRLCGFHVSQTLLAYNKASGALRTSAEIVVHLGYDLWWQQDMRVLPLHHLSQSEVRDCCCEMLRHFGFRVMVHTWHLEGVCGGGVGFGEGVGGGGVRKHEVFIFM